MSGVEGRLNAVYVGLGVVAALAVASFVLIVTTVPTKSAVRREVAAAVGSSDLVKIAEAEVTKEASAAGVAVTGQTVVSVREKGDTAVVTLLVAIPGQSALKLAVTLSRTVWNVKNVARA